MKDVEEMETKEGKAERYHVLTVYSRGLDSIQTDILEFVTVLLSFGE